MEKTWEEKFDERFVKGKMLANNTRCYTIATPDKVKEFIRETIKQERARFFEAVKEGRICLNCGKEKDNQPSDWCADCLENE